MNIHKYITTIGQFINTTKMCSCFVILSRFECRINITESFDGKPSLQKKSYMIDRISFLNSINYNSPIFYSQKKSNKKKEHDKRSSRK